MFPMTITMKIITMMSRVIRNMRVIIMTVQRKWRYGHLDYDMRRKDDIAMTTTRWIQNGQMAGEDKLLREKQTSVMFIKALRTKYYDMEWNDIFMRYNFLHIFYFYFLLHSSAFQIRWCGSFVSWDFFPFITYNFKVSIHSFEFKRCDIQAMGEKAFKICSSFLITSSFSSNLYPITGKKFIITSMQYDRLL